VNTLPFPSTQTISAAGHTLHYQYVGPPDKQAPLLVFLHEGLGSIAQWKDFPDKLCTATEHLGLVYERYGFGQSDALKEERPVSYLEDEADTLIEVLDQLNHSQPVILVGHSDGGSIALVAAARYPARIKAVITEAAHIFVEDITIAGIQAAKTVYESNPRLKEALARYHGTHVDSTFYGWNRTWLKPEFYHWNIEHYLPAIICPLLVIQGEDDEYGSSAQVEGIVQQTKGQATSLLVANCGHTPHQQQPTIVLESMCRFILHTR